MSIKKYIQVEQAKGIYKNTTSLLLGSIVGSAVIAWIFWSKVPDYQLLVWLGFIIVIVLGRWLSSHNASKTTITAANSRYWLRLYAFWSLLTGLHWGVVPVFFLSSTPDIYTLFICILYTGYVAAGTSTNTTFSASFYAFALPATGMLVGRFFYEGGWFYSSVGIMISLYFVINCLLSRNAQRLFIEARELNYKNMKLMDDLVVQKDTAVKATLSKDRFLAAASHDLRQPLHSAGLLLSALSQHISNEKGRELLEDLEQNNEALSHSFSSLLDMSKLDAGVVTASEQHIALSDLLRSIFRDYRLRATEKKLKFSCEDAPYIVHTDSVLLERILRNLISNAINYTAKGSVSILITELSGQHIRVLIQDTGIGISHDELDNIFSEYYQINNPERDRNKGFGLGLAITKRLCAILEMPLFVSSRAGHGTIFALYLNKGDPEKAKEKEEQVWPLSDLSDTVVLVIDDDINVCHSMKSLLESWQCEVHTVDSAEQAIKCVVANSLEPDLIVSDYRLRENKTGAQAIEQVCDELNCHIASIVITGDTSPERLKNLTDSGYTVLHKPVSPARLRSAIQRQLAVTKTR